MKQTATVEEAQEILRIVGDPDEIASNLARFREAAQSLSSNHPRFIQEYPMKWVAVYDHNVLSADSLAELLEMVDSRGVDRESIIVRFIEKSDRVLIL